MRDGRTQRLARLDESQGHEAFLASHDVRLVVVEGTGAGEQIGLGRARLVLGRGPGVDVQIDDRALSRQHAVLECGTAGFRVRDLGSTNGIRINERAVQAAELTHGDRLELGSHVLQYVVERREQEPDVYEIVEES